jgi:hypothetical protein
MAKLVNEEVLPCTVPKNAPKVVEKVVLEPILLKTN